MSRASDARWFSRGHLCVARNCVEFVSPAWLFCNRHWALVPAHLQKAIHSNYQAKRRREFVRSVDQAIDAVARAEAA